MTHDRSKRSIVMLIIYMAVDFFTTSYFTSIGLGGGMERKEGNLRLDTQYVMILHS